MPCNLPATSATNASQRASLAELPKLRRLALYEDANENRSIYHDVSCKPITEKAEADMELLSDIFTQGETFLHHFTHGTYKCSRCHNKLFASKDKWKGPCVWPSF